MTRKILPGIPFTLLVNDASRLLPSRAEPKLLNLFPMDDEAQSTLNLLTLGGESQNTCNLFPTCEDSQSEPRLFPFSGDSELDLRICSQAVTSLILAQPSYEPVASTVGTQVVLVSEENLRSPEKGAENREIERVRPLINPIDSQQEGENNKEFLDTAVFAAIAGPSSSSLDLPSTMEAHAHHPVLANATNLGSTAVAKQDEAIPPGNPRPPANHGLLKRSSSFTGVTYYKRTGRWEAHIWYRKQIYLGASSTEIKAARAYDRALIHFRGPAAIGLNFNVDDYAGELQQLKEISSDDLIAALRKQSAGAGMPMPNYRSRTSRT